MGEAEGSRNMGAKLFDRIPGRVSARAWLLGAAGVLTAAAAAVAVTGWVAPGTDPADAPPSVGDYAAAEDAPAPTVDGRDGTAPDAAPEEAPARGASVMGRAVTIEVCDAVAAVAAAGGGSGGVWPASPELVAATENLAGVEGQNQERYAAYVQLLKSTEDGALDAAGLETLRAYEEALRVDTATCA